VVVAAAGLLFIGQLSADLFSTRIALWVSIVGLTIYFRGWKTVRVLAFPLSFLLLAIPVPIVLYNEIVFPLQLLASRFASFALDQTGVVQVLREGNLLILPNMTLQVVEACSGIRSLMSLLALAVGYSYLAEGSFAVRALLVAATVPLAIVSNGCRVISAAILSYYWGPKMAEGFLHSFSGWVIFMVATVLLISWHGVLLTASKLAMRVRGLQ
jgi:exosortase